MSQEGLRDSLGCILLGWMSHSPWVCASHSRWYPTLGVQAKLLPDVHNRTEKGVQPIVAMQQWRNKGLLCLYGLFSSLLISSIELSLVGKTLALLSNGLEITSG